MSKWIDDIWINAIANLLHSPEVESRDGDTTEMLGFNCVLDDLNFNFLTNPSRALSPVYASAELLWYLSGSKNIEMIEAYAPQYKRFAEPNGFGGLEAYGAYGHRWGINGFENQLKQLLQLLTEKPDTRQAIVTMWDRTDLFHAILGDHKDLPCTISLQFLIRNESLHLIATMRSNDIWLGFPYDVYCFTSLQRLLAGCLGLKEGKYWHQAGSEHLYRRNYEKANKVLNYQRYLLLEQNEAEYIETEEFFRQCKIAVELESIVRRTKQLDWDLFNKLGSSILKDSVLWCASKWIEIKPNQFCSLLFRFIMNDKI